MKFICEKPPIGVAATTAGQFTARVPAIKTARLSLRAPVVTDFTLYKEIVCTDRGQYVGGPMSHEDAWYDFIQLASSWMLHGHGGWSVCLHDNGAVIGFVLLGMEPGDREVELGYLFAAASEGSGYATEATLAVRDWAYSHYLWDSLVSYIDRRNAQSIKLAERIGAVRDMHAENEINEELPEFLVYRHRR